MQAGEEFSCSQRRSGGESIVCSRVRRGRRCENITAAIEVRRHHILVIASYGFLDYLCHMQLHESRDRRLADDYGANTHSRLGGRPDAP